MLCARTGLAHGLTRGRSVFGIVILVTLGFAFKSGSEMLMGEDDGASGNARTAV